MKGLTAVLLLAFTATTAFAEEGQKGGRSVRLLLPSESPVFNAVTDRSDRVIQTKEETTPAQLILYRRRTHTKSADRTVEFRATATSYRTRPVVGVALAVTW